MLIKKTCGVCNKIFEIYLSGTKRGRGKYCSRKCYDIFQKCKKVSKETRIKISQSHIGKRLSKETREKMRLFHLGSKLSEETKRKISKHHADFRGNKSPNWKGGRRINNEGYVIVYSFNHPNPIIENFVYEHRLIVEKHLGRYLKSSEIVHHINKNRSDNRIENLMLCKNTLEHFKFHKGINR